VTVFRGTRAGNAASTRIAREHRLPLSSAGANVGLIKALLLDGMILFSVATLGARDWLAVRVSPIHSFAPADINIYVTVEPNADNRLLSVSAESPEFFRSSEMSLDGADNARVTILRFRELPSGTYEVTADVSGANGRRRGVARCEFTVE
jgi:hypothetical protein